MGPSSLLEGPYYINLLQSWVPSRGPRGVGLVCKHYVYSPGALSGAPGVLHSKFLPQLFSVALWWDPEGVPNA